MQIDNLRSRFKSAPQLWQSFSSALLGGLSRLSPWSVPSLAVMTLVLAVASGILAFKLELRFVEAALAGIVLFLLALCGVEFVFLALLTISSTLFNVDTLPYLFGFSSANLAVFFLLALVITNRLLSKESFVYTPLNQPVILFLGMVIVSFLNAHYNLGTVKVFRTPTMGRMLLYLVFFAVINLIQTRQQLMKLVGGMLLLATITAALMVAQQIVGSTIIIMPGQKQLGSATALGQELVGTVRLSSIGAVTICMMLFPALLLQIAPEYMKGHRWLLYIPLLLFPLAIAFTFDRNLWVGIAIAGMVLILIVRSEGSYIILLISTLLIGAILLAILLNAYFPRIETIFDALSMRFMSLFAGDELEYDHSTQWRLLENEYAMRSIRKHPLLGIGPGATYRPYVEALGGDSLSHYVHNAYLWLLVDFGIVGFLPFLWFSILFLIRGIFAWYTLEDTILRSLALGFTMGYIVILVSSIAAPRFLTTYSAVLVGVVLGINEVIIRLGQPANP